MKNLLTEVHPAERCSINTFMRFRGERRFLFRLALAVGAVWLGIACQGQILTLSDANSVAMVNVGSQEGMFYWGVDGVNQLHQQWFWYRIGGLGPESSIDTISAPEISGLTLNAMTVTYGNALFNLNTTYILRGGLPGSGNSDIGESIVINNISGAPLDFHFYQYSDFDLAGTPQDDFTALSTSRITGLYNEAAVWDANFMLTENVDTIASPGANHGETAPVGVTLARLNDANPTTLNDNAGPIGPSHNTWALEWDLNIATGDTVIISKDKNLQAVVVPEPTVTTLIFVGVVLYGVRWFRRLA